MGDLLRRELNLRKPLSSLEEEAFLQVARTADWLQYEMAQLFKQQDLTSTQYNALRVLRGAGEEGLTCQQVGARLINRVPDVTRLLDRLEQRGMIRRRRLPNDRRVVRVTITEAGRNVLEFFEKPVEEAHRQQLGHLSQEQLRTLCDLLETARSASDAPQEVGRDD